MCMLSVSNVIYHKFSHGATFYTLNGKNVNVMLEFEMYSMKYKCSVNPDTILLTHYILVDSSTVIYWKSPFVILGCQVYFVTFILFLMENPVNKH